MKLAVLGTGKIVTEALYALQAVADIEVTAIWSRPESRGKAEHFAAQYAIPAVYTDYELLLSESDADTVYIGLVNSVHFEYAKKALESGRHVILEKPFTWLGSEARELKELAARQGCFLFEAITVLHNGIFERMREQLPQLGQIRMLLANYSQYSSRYDDYLLGKVSPAFDPACLGGALGDINVYNVHFAVGLFGKPESAVYYPNMGFSGADVSGTLVLRYPGFSAVCTGAKDSDSPCFVSVQGERGWMRIDGKPNAAERLLTVCPETGAAAGKDASGAMVRKLREERTEEPIRHHRMVREFEDFAEIIRTGDRARADALLEETAAVVETLEEARRSAGISY